MVEGREYEMRRREGGNTEGKEKKYKEGDIVKGSRNCEGEKNYRRKGKY